MEWKTFIVHITDTLAWPALILIIVLVFKEQFISLIKSVSELRIGNAAAFFGKTVLANTIHPSQSVQESTTEQSEMTKDEILSIPDDDYEFLIEIANNVNFMPTSKSEIFKYNSLVNNGYFEKNEKQNNVYKPTKKGEEIIKALKSIYYS